MTVRKPSTITAAERHILEHATGWRSKQPLYRNHYVAGPEQDCWPTLQALRARGLMRPTRESDEVIGGMHCYAVTEEGVALLTRVAEGGESDG